ncbi:HAD-IA family hydrolase [Breoghania sp.]|uniref:HAD-IA family hydrolase n=1 Tax=Breoghania sp. TaxID=2065378 RepID=UPI0026075405|nr:HAD-IA family hydrolase [Breoghania sp.]MDJ0929938.1 HAD-IA family hydrolase [Breoghania sp.]
MYLIIFDCDGTLVDSQDTIVSGMDAAFSAVGLVPPRAASLGIVGLSLEVAIDRLVEDEHRHLVPQMAEVYRASKIAERKVGGGLDPLYPGARAAIDALHARDDVLLGVATGKALRGVVRMVEVHDRLVTIQTADRAPSKPHPGMILQAMEEETGASPENTVMIGDTSYGDTSYDVAMARNAGVTGMGVSWGYHDRPLLTQAGAATILDDFADLVPELGRKFGWQIEGIA